MNRMVVYVESAEEQVAYLIAQFGPKDAWSVRDQRMATGPGGEPVERARLRTASGEVEIEFRDASPAVSFQDAVRETDRTAALEAVMQRASTFAAENPPHHPGSLPRFPVPIEHYGDAVGVPLPILAMDDAGRRGLFAPPRMAVVSWSTHEPIGVRDFPDFDPDNWPPRRLGDWPAPQTMQMPSEQLDAMIRRFSACWSRVIDAWFAATEPREVLRADVAASLALRNMLDPDAMNAIYRQMNPRFADWLEAIGARDD